MLQQNAEKYGTEISPVFRTATKIKKIRRAQICFTLSTKTDAKHFPIFSTIERFV